MTSKVSPADLHGVLCCVSVDARFECEALAVLAIFKRPKRKRMRIRNSLAVALEHRRCRDHADGIGEQGFLVLLSHGSLRPHLNSSSSVLKFMWTLQEVPCRQKKNGSCLRDHKMRHSTTQACNRQEIKPDLPKALMWVHGQGRRYTCASPTLKSRIPKANGPCV